MKICTVHFLDAGAGDCILIEFENKDCVLIDGGYRTTWKNKLKPLLIKLASKGCRIILFIVTHSDRDHIEGAISFLQENKFNKSPDIIPVDNVWYNGFHNTLFNLRFVNKLGENDLPKTKTIVAALLANLPGEEGDISASLSSGFEELCLKYGYALNTPFADGIVKMESNKKKTVQMRDVKISVLSPSIREINALADYLDREFIKVFNKGSYQVINNSSFMRLAELIQENDKNEFQYPDYEYISSEKDTLSSWLCASSNKKISPVNKSSIVIEIEYKDLKMLFTGDSDSNLWGKIMCSKYNIVKAAHHGTFEANEALLKNTQADYLLISTNGGVSKCHPDKRMLAQAILGKNFKTLCFNSTVRQKDSLEKWQGKYNFTCKFNCNTIEL